MEKEMYKIREVAELLSLHPKTVEKLARDKKIKSVKIGRDFRITREEIERIKKEGVER